MPPLETCDLKQKAALWSANGVDREGEYKVDAVVGIRTRWEIGRTEAKGILSSTIAFDELVIVDREIAVGSIMRKGDVELVPDPPTNLREVVDYIEVPDLKGRARFTRRYVKLIKHSNELPTLA